jgi:hypothetical protein
MSELPFLPLDSMTMTYSIAVSGLGTRSNHLVSIKQCALKLVVLLCPKPRLGGTPRDNIAVSDNLSHSDTKNRFNSELLHSLPPFLPVFN